jgi:hypothetical protein
MLEFFKYKEELMQKDQYIEFGEALGEEDWGLIFDSEGGLKGIYIPKGKEDDIVPESIVEICEKYFGVDLETEFSNNTLH